jgi:hypothetical protein
MIKKGFNYNERVKFKEWFGLELADYWQGMLGFNVRKFDEWLHTKGYDENMIEESMVTFCSRTFPKNQYGMDAGEFVRGLLG